MKVIFSIRYAAIVAFVVFLLSVFNAQAASLGTNYVDLYGTTRTCNTTYQNTNSYWILVNAGDSALVSANSYRSWFMGTTTFVNGGDTGSYNINPNRVPSSMYSSLITFVAPGIYYHLYCGGDTSAGFWFERPYYGFEEPVPGTSTTTQETVVNIDLASTTAELEEIKAINTFGTFVFVFLGIITWLLYLFKLFGTPKKYDY